MKAFVIAETEKAARALCAGARSKADIVTLIAPGFAPVVGIADTAFHIDVPDNRMVDDAYVSILPLLDQEQPELVLVESTRRMKAIAGRLAAHIGTAVITDVAEFNDNTTITRYFGGIAQRTSKAIGSTMLLTIGAGAFEGLEATGSDTVVKVAFQEPERSLEVIGTKDLPKSDIDLAAAKVIVAGGRGFTEKEDLALMYDLASSLGGECGCTRPLAEGVDWMPREAYIGVSGVMCSPNVYVGIGVSGQMQHMVGVNRANAMFAINKDKNAPVFKQCDYGLVGDLKTVLPALVAAL